MVEFIGTLNDASFVDLNLDAFIFGNKNYAVRLTASFDYGQMKDLLGLIKKQNKKAYVSVNKLFTQDEIKGLEEYLISIKDLGVDGILFSDMAVYQIAKRNGFDSLLIYDPDTLMVNSFDVKFFNELGIQSVVLSKDISLDDIVACGNRNPGFITIYSYGHFPLFYSKRKLVENYFYAYEKDPTKYIENRNLLTQEITRNEMYPIYQDGNGTIIFSGKKLFYANYLQIMHKEGINKYLFNFMFDDYNEAKKIISMYRQGIKESCEFDESNYTTGYLFRKTGVK